MVVVVLLLLLLYWIEEGRRGLVGMCCSGGCGQGFFMHPIGVTQSITRSTVQGKSQKKATRKEDMLPGCCSQQPVSDCTGLTGRQAQHIRSIIGGKRGQDMNCSYLCVSRYTRTKNVMMVATILLVSDGAWWDEEKRGPQHHRAPWLPVQLCMLEAMIVRTDGSAN